MLDEGGPAGFEPTMWSVVLRAADAADPDRRRALDRLCQTYWKPIYVFCRHKGLSIEEAQDATQGFFAYLLEKDLIERAAPDRGRFRSFLLGVLRRYLANRFRGDRAARRGGGRRPLSFDFERAETEVSIDPGHDETPERVFWRSWALSVLQGALEALRAEFEEQGRRERFAVLREHLLATGDRDTQRQLADRLGLSVTDVNNLLHRTRGRLRQRIRDRIRETVESEEDLEEEIRLVLDSL